MDRKREQLKRVSLTSLLPLMLLLAMETEVIPETKVTLTRLSTSEAGTYGVLSVNGQVMFVTLERPWADNKPNVSCIPTGRYNVRMRYSLRFKRKLYEVEGVKGRSDILIHPGNTVEDTSGCILLGEKRESTSVLNSRRAIELLHKRLGGKPFVLEVRDAWP